MKTKEALPFSIRFVRALDELTGGKIAEHYLKAAVGLEGTDQADEGKYRRFSQKNVRDLTPMQYQKIQQMAFYQWQRYPLAKRIIDLLVDFIVGEDLGIKVKIMKRTEDDDVDTQKKDGQQVWDDFFEDPINRLDEDLSTIISDFMINGELVLPAFVNDTNGKVRLGYIDPAFIKEVKSVPKNSREIDLLVLVPPEDTKEEPLKVIRYDADPNSPTFGKLAGDGFFFRINHVTTQKRGHSELTQHLDWIDAFEQFLFGVLDGFDARNTFFYDLMMKGKTQDELDKLSVPRPQTGEVKLHNENAEWEVKSPDLKAVDASEAVKLIRNFIVGTKGFPDHWFGEGSDVNLATAQVMSKPTIRMIKRKQGSVKIMLRTIAEYVLQCAVDKQQITLEEGEYFEVEVSMFDVERQEAAVIGVAFVQIVTALKIATASGWISDDNAKKIVDGIVGMLGVEIDSNENVEDIKANNKTNEDVNALDGAPPVNEFLKQQTQPQPQQKGQAA
jgi:hypothetical protein